MVSGFLLCEIKCYAFFQNNKVAPIQSIHSESLGCNKPMKTNTAKQFAKRFSKFVSLFSLCFLFYSSVCFSDEQNLNLINEHIVNGEFDKAAIESQKHESHYLSQLITQSRSMGLANDPVWQVLILYKKTFFNGLESQVDGPDFFMSKSGKTDPQKELEATLASFFSNKELEHAPFLPKCRFVARYYWLNKKLGLDESRIPSRACTKFNEFYKTVRPDAITVVFPSANPNGPSSMFGHTLLRIDRKNQTKSSRMLAFSVNFAAMIDPNTDAMTYAAAGLGGGFPGQYAILPYYMKLREYGQLENRDIWEYKLKLSQDQIDFIVMHAYELVPTYFDYYFFTENCSYHLLSLIDVAFAKKTLTDEFDYWAIPIDTVKLLEHRGLIHSTTYQPSHRKIIEAKQKEMTQVDQDIAFQLYKENNELLFKNIASFDKQRQAAILDYTYDLLRYEKLSKAELMDVNLNKRERSILKKRSKLRIRSPKITPDIPDARPDEGHGSARATVNLGMESDETYTEIAWRSAYHDLLDPTPGYMFGYGLSFVDVRLRYNFDAQQAELNKLTFINLTSLTPRDKVFPNFSWHIESNIQNLPNKLFSEQTYFDVTGGGGASYHIKVNRNNLIYALADASITAGKILDNNYSVGGGATVGSLVSLTPRWIFKIQAKGIKGLLGDKEIRYDLELSQSYRLARNLAIELDLHQLRFKSQRWKKFETSLLYYF